MPRDLVMRSAMFVPGHRQRMVDRALGLGAFFPLPLDLAILDVEDGVPGSEKANARRIVASVLRAASADARRTAPVVRVNRTGGADFEADVAALEATAPAAVVLPKVDEAGEVRRAALRLGPVPLIPSIESARGLLEAAAIAAVDGVIALLFGAEDFALDLGLPAERTAEAAELLFARSAVVVAAAAARRQAIDGIWPDVRDAVGLRRDALVARRLGFSGKSLIHPDQVNVVNDVFSPSDEEVDHARRVIAAFEEGAKRGSAALTLDGKLLDAPIVERARRVLRLRDRVSNK